MDVLAYFVRLEIYEFGGGSFGGHDFERPFSRHFPRAMSHSRLGAGWVPDYDYVSFGGSSGGPYSVYEFRPALALARFVLEHDGSHVAKGAELCLGDFCHGI